MPKLSNFRIVTPPRMVWFGWNLAAWCRITCRLWGCHRNRHLKKNFNMADVWFSKPEIVVKSPRCYSCVSVY